MVLSYRFRLIGILSAILLIAFIGVSVLNYQSTKSSVRDEIVSTSLPLTREIIHSEILADLVPAINISSYMAHDLFLIDWSTSGEVNQRIIIDYLEDIKETYGYFSTFFISHSTKNYYHFNGILKKISPANDHDVWYYTFVDSDKAYDLDVDTNEAADNRLTIFINYRMMDSEGNFLGVVGVGVEMKSFAGFLADKQREYERDIYLVDADGYIQAHSDKALIKTTSLYERPGMKEIADDLLRLEDNGSDKSYRTDQHRILVTSRYLPELGWYLVVEQDETLTLHSARRNLFRTVLTGIATSIVIILISALAVNYFQKRLELMAVTDRLTGVANRREFEKQFAKSVYRFKRYETPFSLILFDIDNFKQVNDTIGHQGGDRLLVEMAGVVGENIRPTDVIARWGGDEFAILTENHLDSARQTAERMRNSVISSDFGISQRKAEMVTISIGVAEFRSDDTIDILVSRADRALYRSKAEGKNRVTVAS